MREDPGIDAEKISASLEAHHGLRVASVAFFPLGYDPNAAVYEVVSGDGVRYFLKVRFGRGHGPSLLVPRTLTDLGIRNVLAPMRTRSSGLWCPLVGYPGYGLVLYPLVRAESAMVTGLSDDQWREFGSTLQAVHASKIGESLRDPLPVETFSLPSVASVRRIVHLVQQAEFEDTEAARLAASLRGHADQIHRMLSRAGGAGRLASDQDV